MQIEVLDASMSFGQRLVFHNISATFHAGAVTALTGPSGSGKSTLLAAMAGHVRLTGGTIRHLSPDGRSVLPDPGSVAWVPQGNNVLGHRTALDNVMIGPLAEGLARAQAQAQAERALVDVGLGPLARQRTSLLSGGERQRVTFARALATSKPLIFADEPSASLDETNTMLLAQLLTSWTTTATIVVASHDPIIIRAANDVVAMRHG